MCVCVWEWVQTRQEGVRSLGAGVTRGYKLFSMGADEHTRYSLLIHFSSLYKTKIFYVVDAL